MDTREKYEKAERLLECARKRAIAKEALQQIEYVTINSSGYAEPGYSGDVVATGDWNTISRFNQKKNEWVAIDDTMRWLAKVLEAAGVEIEWSDEWEECEGCNKLVRTQADSYGWQPSYRRDDSGLLCVHCLKEDPVEYLESMEGDFKSANTISSIDPANHGYVLLQDAYEHGFHRGQDADPKLVAKALDDQGVCRYLFNIDDVGQFDMKFSVYVHESEVELLDRKRFEKENTDGPSVSAAMERGLREGSLAANKLQGDGIRHTSVHADGTTEVRLISPEDFVRKGFKP